MKKYVFLLFLSLILVKGNACSGKETDHTFDTAANNSMANDSTDSKDDLIKTNSMIIKIGDTVLTATLTDNSSSEALKKALSERPVTVKMRDYGKMEKVGSLGMTLPRNDEFIATEAGDIILYQGSELVIYYSTNSWNFTRLGKIDNVTPEGLKKILGDGDVSVTLSLPAD
jgi:hypothetical protein